MPPARRPEPRVGSNGTRMRTLRSSRVGMARPCSSLRRRSCARAMAWNVPAVTEWRTPRRARRARSSPAALRVKVTASTCDGSMSCSRDCHAMRRVRTRVLPEPAPARIASGAARLVTASRCVGSRPWRSASTAARYRPGTTVTGSPVRRFPVRDSRRPRVVSAASQLGSPRGRSRRPLPTPRLRVAPGARPRSSSPGSLASRGWSRSARSPHRILPVRCPDAAPPSPQGHPRGSS